MNAVEGQTELRLARRGIKAAVSIEQVRGLKSSGAAFSLACLSSGLEDKEIYNAFREPIDSGTFSRMKKGTNTLGGDYIAEFCEIVNNTIYPEWIASRVGCGLVLLKSEAERLLDERTAELEREREKLRLLTEIMQGKK